MRVPSSARRPRRLMGIVAFVLVAAATTAQAAVLLIAIVIIRFRPRGLFGG